MKGEKNEMTALAKKKKKMLAIKKLKKKSNGW